MKGKIITKKVSNKAMCIAIAATVMVGCLYAHEWTAHVSEVDGISMLSTLHSGNHVYILPKKDNEYKRGEIVSFINPEDGDRMIKRVIAVAGDEIKIVDGTGEVYVNGELLNEDYINKAEEIEQYGGCDITIPENHVFVMGDNRNHSCDSREFGAISVYDIIGKACLIF